MKKIKSKVISCLVAAVMLVCSGILLTACGKNDTNKVMNLSMNPSIELVLDGDNKVVTVNAINDEGNFIISNATFTGLSAEDAVDLFIKTTEEYGFVDTTLSATDNKLQIEISGEDAEKIYNKVKKSADEVLSDLGLSVTVSLQSLTKDNLESLVAECMQELSATEIDAKSEEELLNLIKASREETKNFMSQELKELYYNARADELIKEKFESIKSQLDSLSTNPAVAIAKAGFDIAYSTLTGALNSLNTLYAETFLDTDSPYQKAVNKFMTDKKALLEARVNSTTTDFTALKEAVETAEKALNTAKTNAETAINGAKTTLLQAVTAIETAMNSIASYINTDTVSTAVNTAKTEFKANFETQYQIYIQNNYWKDGLKPAVNQ